MKNVSYRLSVFATTVLFMLGTTGAISQEQAPKKRGDARVQDESKPPEGGRRARGNPQQQIQQMKEHLGLSDKQVQDIQGVFQQYRPQMAELRTKYQGSGDREAARAEMISMQEKIQKDINSFLTADQQKKWKQIQKQRRERMQQGQRGPRGESPEGQGDAAAEGPPPPKVNP